MAQYYDPYDPYDQQNQSDGGDPYAPPQVGQPDTGTSQTKASVGNGGFDSVPGYALQATAKPGSYAAPPPDAKVKQLVADFIKSKGLSANQSDPSSLKQIVEYLRTQGVNAQVDYTDENGHTGGIQIDGHPYQLIDGSNNWTTLQPWDMGGGDDWFTQNAPQMPEAYTTLARPDYLQGEYKPPVWDETFVAPDANTLFKDPGYQSRLAAAQKGFERSAAAKGSILSGGSQVALGREQQTLASNEYASAFGRAYDTYRQKYGQFQDRLAASAGARSMNENAYGNDVANNLNQYGTRYRSYRDAIDDQFRLSDQGFRATTAGAPA